MQYCQVINGTPQTPQNLPVTWLNVSNFNCLPAADLVRYGFYPFIPAVQPAFNPAIQKLVQELHFDGEQVNQLWTVANLTDAEKMDYLRGQRAMLKSFLDRYMDSQVAPKDYDNILTACTWINASNQEWASDAQTASAFREECFKRAYQIESDVLAGLRPVPTEAEFQAAMPVLWSPPLPPGTGNGTLS